MEAVWTGAVGNTISNLVSVVFDPLVQIIDDIINLDRNTLLLQQELSSAKVLRDEMANQFESQQRSPPADVNERLTSLRLSIQHAESVIHRSQQGQGCSNCRFCKPRLCGKIREHKLLIVERREDLAKVISTRSATQGIVLSEPVQAGALLQPVPESGFVGLGIKSAEKELNTWIDGEDNEFRVIGVVGMGGVGKTSLLKTVYNSHKNGNVFQAVIWLTVSQKFDILVLLDTIAKEINLDLGTSSSNAESSSAVLDMPRRRIYNFLKQKKFLLVLDDMWNPIQLEELGIPLSKDKGSKVVISTRNRDVILRMGANDYSIQIQPLSMEEGWQLFCRVAFNAGDAPTKVIEDTARNIAKECKGLPLAITVVAAAMRGNTNSDEWQLALSQMKTVDPEFLKMYSGIDEDLYGRLKWSYDRLNDCNLQNCFLYCGAFPEDAVIKVDRLVEMWIGEGLVNSRDRSHLMDAGRRYVKILIERCLFEDAGTNSWNRECIKVHDIIRDMALYIAEKEEKCLFSTSQKLDDFPADRVMEDCKRIAIRYYNEKAFLPTDFRCPALRTLILGGNEGLREVPSGFLLRLTSLRVLDLSDTNITSLPESMWQLKQLEFLGLNRTEISGLPAEVCNLSRLQFLHLQRCKQLESLPCTIKELTNLKHLDLSNCERLAGIPHEISQLTSLNSLQLGSRLGVDEAESGMCSLKDFTNFPNLMELQVRVRTADIVDGKRSGIKMGMMGTWFQMKHLLLAFDPSFDVMEDLPPDMQNMKNLQTFHLDWYGGISLPNCICDFERLEELYLFGCDKLEELPPLERLPNLRVLSLLRLSKVRELGIRGSVGGFPMLERLSIKNMLGLESISSSSSNVEWTEGTMPKLQFLRVYDCSALKRLPVGIEKLCNLKEIGIEEDVWERSIQADSNIQICLQTKVKFVLY